MGFLSHRVKRSDLEAGDHIYTWRTPVYAYAHHGIYSDVDKVVHFITQEHNSSSENSTFTSFRILLLLDSLSLINIYRIISFIVSASVCCKWGIYIGDDKVVHFTQDQKLSSPISSFTCFSSVPNTVATCLDLPDCSCGERRSGVIMSCLNCFLGNGSLHRFEYGVSGVVLVSKLRGGTCTTAKSDPPEEAIHRAMHLLQKGFGNYDLYTKNCENFALYCKTGLICGRKSFGGSGQVSSSIGIAMSAIKSLSFKIFTSNTVVLAATTVGNYTLSRYAADLGVRSDVVKVKVEDLEELLIIS